MGKLQKKGALDWKPHLIKFTSCLPMVGGSLRVLWLPQENQREYCNDCYIFMTDVLFQFCHDIICIDVSKTHIPSCFYFHVFEHKEAKSGKSCYVRVRSAGCLQR